MCTHRSGHRAQNTHRPRPTTRKGRRRRRKGRRTSIAATNARASERRLFVSRVAFLTFRDGDRGAEDEGGGDGDEGKRGESRVGALHDE